MDKTLAVPEASPHSKPGQSWLNAFMLTYCLTVRKVDGSGHTRP